MDVEKKTHFTFHAKKKLYLYHLVLMDFPDSAMTKRYWVDLNFDVFIKALDMELFV
jgi:hypothetical protein